MSSAATATSAAAAAATTAGSGAGEGAEEAAKDSADIAAFFRSGECGPVPGPGCVWAEGAAARPRRRKVEGSGAFLPELGEGGEGSQPALSGGSRRRRGRLSSAPFLGEAAVRGPARVGAAWPGGSGEESRAPLVPCPGGLRGFHLGPATRGRDATLCRQIRGVKTGAAGGPARPGACAGPGAALRRCRR